MQPIAGVLTLDKALAQTLMGSPELAAISWDSKIGEARMLQAGLLPNPEISYELSDFGGSGVYSGLNGSSSLVQLGQLVELGGKRSKRTHLAAVEKELADWDIESKKLDVLAETNRNFLDVLTGQEKIGLTAELVRLAERARDTVLERVQAGKVSPLEGTKAGVALSETRIQLTRAQNELAAARSRLAASMGLETASFQRVSGKLETLAPIPSAEDLNAYLDRNPDIARWVKEKEQRDAALAMEKAKRIPDVTISGGMQYYADTDDSALLVGISVPLPLFDRNQGNIAEAEHRRAKAREESRSSRTKAVTTLSDAYRMLASSYAESKSLQDDIVPAAQKVFADTEEGFREGKFDFLELLDAQRTLFTAKESYIASLSNYHKAVVDVERLIATPLAEVSAARPHPRGARS
ncbi:MAG: TolC family protein [Desulfobulbus sp.]|jgi:cobalt-zinc-cadmium efflux system outer membrane protein|uniref:TolC family protein n=1 Tax=Desulfobulbus sp. TaxID=895 RepID=UPI002846C8A3|nr:TolC family protein [Desulfobulbus sp.]MDR2549905.1 TolC family protein [Desulfobulbus sp.]